MKRIIVICEGQTEQEFCKNVLYAYFISKSIIIECPLIKKSNGGIVSWNHLKRQIEGHLREDTSARVTTLIDYYGTQEKHNFPGWRPGIRIPDRYNRMVFLESAMKEDIDQTHRYRFIPYIQLHEFEGLLFNDVEVFKQQIPGSELVDIEEIERIIAQYPNCELINEGVDTAPSKRLQRLIFGYNKPVYGAILAEAIGLTKIRNKSPRFNNWIIELEKS